MASISSLGIGSGVLSSSLVDKLVSAERKATDTRLQAQTQTVKAKEAAFAKVTSAITDLRLPARTLGEAGSLNVFKGTSSNSAVAVSVDSSKASAGSYSVDVQHLAKAQSLASGAVSNPDAASLGAGTLTFVVGGTVKNITVDSSNNSLNSLAKTINDANFGVSAGVVNTGSGYKLVLSSGKTGTDNAMTISVNDSDGNNTDASGLSQLAFNSNAKNLTETVAAQDAQLTVNGISISRSTNTVDNVINGVTLNLSGTGTSQVNVSQDTGAAADKVQAFVDKYNAIVSTVQQLTKYDPTQQSGSVLTGDPTVTSMMSQLRQTLGQIVPGLSGSSVRSLADAGVTTDPNSGQLKFDRTKFVDQLTKHPRDVEALFSTQGRASDAGVSVVSQGTNTKPGTYDLNITQAATQGSYAGSVALGSSVTIDTTNNTFSIQADNGTAASITLTQGTYTPASLVTEIQSQLDANTSLNSQGQSIKVGLDVSNHLTFTSGSFGSSSNVAFTAVGSGSAASLGLTTGSGTAGTDVAGTVNGQTATGNGQTLKVFGTGPADGLTLKVTGSQTGSRGTITSIEGIGQRTVDTITGFMDTHGIVSNKNDGYQKKLADIASQQKQLNDQMTAYRNRLVKEFTAADKRVAQFKSTLNFLQSQMAASGGGGGGGGSSSGSSGG